MLPHRMDLRTDHYIQVIPHVNLDSMMCEPPTSFLPIVPQPSPTQSIESISNDSVNISNASHNESITSKAAYARQLITEQNNIYTTNTSLLHELRLQCQSQSDYIQQCDQYIYHCNIKLNQQQLQLNTLLNNNTTEHNNNTIQYDAQYDTQYKLLQSELIELYNKNISIVELYNEQCILNQHIQHEYEQYKQSTDVTIDELKASITVHEDSINQLNKQYNELQNTYTTSNQQVIDLTNDNVSLRHTNQQQQTTIDSIDAVYDELNQQCTTLIQSNSTLEHDQLHLQQQLYDKTQLVDELYASITNGTTIDTDTTKLTTELSHLQNYITQLHQHKLLQTNELHTLKQLNIQQKHNIIQQSVQIRKLQSNQTNTSMNTSLVNVDIPLIDDTTINQSLCNQLIELSDEFEHIQNELYNEQQITDTLKLQLTKVSDALKELYDTHQSTLNELHSIQQLHSSCNNQSPNDNQPMESDEQYIETSLRQRYNELQQQYQQQKLFQSDQQQYTEEQQQKLLQSTNRLHKLCHSLINIVRSVQQQSNISIHDLADTTTHTTDTQPTFDYGNINKQLLASITQLSSIKKMIADQHLNINNTSCMVQ